MKKFYRYSTQLTTKRLNDVLNSVFRSISSNYEVCLEDFIKNWPKIIGKDFVFMTKILGYKEEKLFIGVNNTSLYALLYHHKKKEILIQIHKNYPKWKVKDIIFKIS